VRNTGDVGKFKIVSQSAIASGVRRVEALRDKQLVEFLNNKEKQTDILEQKNDQIISKLSKEIISLGGKPTKNLKDKKQLIKDLSKQLDQLSVKSILSDKKKNIINDEKIKNINIRFQKIYDLSPKELRKLVDNGKKELKDGIIIVFAIKDEKVGLAVGITEKLTKDFDAVKFAKVGSEILGGKGGGGRKDFAQAGGQYIDKMDEAIERLKKLV